jgi:hypothetical protein
MDVQNFYKELFVDTLGLDVLGLEKQFPALVKLVETKTIVTFSNYIPALYMMYLDLTDESNIIRNDHGTLGTEYYLSDPVLEKFHLPILGVEKIDYNNVGQVDPYDPNSTAYYSSIIASRNNITLESVLMGSEYTYNRTLTDFAFPWKRYHEYRGGNVLYLRNYAFGGTAEITVKTRFPNLVSIPEEYREIFITLAKYDVRIFLWNWLKYLTDIVTPSGNLDLRFDWSDAERDREDYLKELRTKTLPDRVFSRYFTIV